MSFCDTVVMASAGIYADCIVAVAVVFRFPTSDSDAKNVASPPYLQSQAIEQQNYTALAVYHKSPKANHAAMLNWKPVQACLI